MPKVSVIMPSLNVVNFIGECLESVTKQTFSDIEIIIVDAGSDDGTMEIVQKYSTKDERIKIIHSKIRSYGYQMNLGLNEAQGKYVGILETDDILPLDTYEKLLRYIEVNNLDYVKGYPKLFWDLGNGSAYVVEVSNLSSFYKGIICPAEIPKLLCEDIFIWTGLYKRDFVVKMNFNETLGAAYQDQGFLLQTISQSKRAMYVDEFTYYYRQDNLNASQFNERGFQYIFDEYRLNKKKAISLGECWERAFYARFVIQSLGRFQRMAISGKKWSSADEYIVLLREKMLQVYNEKKIYPKLLGKYNYSLMHLFMYSPLSLYNCLRDVYCEKLIAINLLIKWAGNKKIIIWGCGKCGRYIQALLLMNHISVEAFIDNNSSLWNGSVQGCKVISPKVAKEKYLNYLFLIAVKWQSENIKMDIIKWGVNPENIYYYEGDYDYNFLMDATFETV